MRGAFEKQGKGSEMKRPCTVALGRQALVASEMPGGHVGELESIDEIIL